MVGNRLLESRLTAPLPRSNPYGPMPGEEVPDSEEELAANESGSDSDEHSPRKQLPGAWSSPSKGKAPIRPSATPSSVKTKAPSGSSGTPTTKGSRTPVGTPKRAAEPPLLRKNVHPIPRSTPGTPSSSKKKLMGKPILVGDPNDPDIVEIPSSVTPMNKAATSSSRSVASVSRTPLRSPIKKSTKLVIEISSDSEMDNGTDTDVEIISASSTGAVRGSLSFIDISSDAETELVDDTQSRASSTRAVRGSLSTMSFAKPGMPMKDDIDPPFGSENSELEVSRSRLAELEEQESDDSSSGITVLSQTSSWCASTASICHDQTGQYDIYANHWNKNQRERKVAGGPIMLTPEMFRQRRRNELADCAEQVYTYFNKKVFQSKLPDLDNVVITWSNKLTSTAGQSRFIRDPETKTKVVAQILLSVKILDSVVKVRLTMAHEMCHLATWLLDNRLQESHGELFWKWARRINKLDSDTEITQYHDYEINFLYTWICLNLNCGHIMGRWRDSIDINTARCNKCKTGKLRVMSTPHIDDHRVVDRNMSSKQARQPKPKAKKTQSTPLSPSTPTKTAPKSQSTPVLNEIRQKEYARESESDSDEEDSNLGIVPAGRKWLVVDDDSDKDQNPQHKSVDELAKMFGGIIITTKSCGDGPSAGKRHKKKNAKAKQTL